MTLLWIALTALAAEPASSATSSNPVFLNLAEQGVPLPGGSAVKLPRPTMASGLDAAGQRAAMERIPQLKHPLDELLRKSIVAPFELTITSLKEAGGSARRIDVWFVAYGNWKTLSSKEFVEGLAKGRESGTPDGRLMKSGFLTDVELAQRKLTIAPKPGLEERYYFSTFTLFDRVEVSVARHAMLSRGPDCFLVAAQIDPRFASDPTYPNRWRSITRDAAGNAQPGPWHPYAAGGLYLQVTRLVEPAGAVFIEFHQVFDEPQGWFGGANLLRSKLPLVVQEEVRTFRRKLAAAK